MQIIHANKKPTIMKKLLTLLFALTTTVLISCDPSTDIYYEVKNSTGLDMTVAIGANSPITIKIGEKEVAYHDNILGQWKNEPFKGPHINPYTLEVKINEKLVSNDFWLREYWNFTKAAELNATYTLTITDELLNSLLSTEEQ